MNEIYWAGFCYLFIVGEVAGVDKVKDCPEKRVQLGLYSEGIASYNHLAQKPRVAKFIW